MKRLLLFALSLISFAGISHAQINFEHGSWSEILAKASNSNKLIFLDAYTTWCGPCKWMAANAFMDPDVGAFFNSHFINAKIDMEKGDGPMLSAKFDVRAYPTLIFVDATGNAVKTSIGALDAQDLLILGKGMSPDLLADTRNDGGMDAGENDTFGPDLSPAAIQNYLNAMSDALAQNNTDAYLDARAAIFPTDDSDLEFQVYQLDLPYFSMINDFESYVVTAHRMAELIQEADPVLLNEIAWGYYQFIDDPEELKFAMRWINISCEMDPTYANLDTKAMLLKKLGRTKEAITFAELAIDAAKKSGEDPSETVKALKEMRNGKTY